MDVTDERLVVDVRAGAVRFRVRVQPRASANDVAGVLAGALRVRLTAPPVEGAANEALIAFLSGRLDVPRRAIRIVAGDRGRLKTLEVSGIDAEAVRRLAGASR